MAKKGCGCAEFAKKLEAVVGAYNKRVKTCSVEELTEKVRQDIADVSTNDSAIGSNTTSRDHSEAKELKLEEKSKRTLLAKCKENGDSLW